MRKTHALVSVAAVLMTDPDARHWGYDLAKRARLQTGTLYPLLNRLLADGLLRDGWEDRVTGRPPRRYYELTDPGKVTLRALLDEARTDRRFASLLGEA